MSANAPDLAALMGGAPPAPGDALGGASVASHPKGDASDTLRHIIDLFNIYMQETHDEQDLAVASDLQAKTQKLLASQQQLVDKATGVGAGARLVRKATQGG